MPVGKQQRGVAYLAILMLVLALGILLAAAAQGWQVQQQRQRESELLFIGQQFRQAIKAYYQSGPAPAYPRSLDALVKDDRVTFTRRHLRRVYVDPFTGKAEWGLVKGADGGIMGVYSLAPGTPLKQQDFPVELGNLSGAASYQQWIFLADNR